MKSKLLVLLLVSGVVAFGQNSTVYGVVSVPTIDSPSQLTDAYQALIGNWLTATTRVINGLFAVLALCDVAWFGIQLRLQKHDFESAIMASTGKLLALGFFWTLLLAGPELFPQLIDMFIQIGRQGSGLQSLGPSEIMHTGFVIAGQLLWQAGKSAFRQDFLGATGIIAAIIAVLIAFLAITVQFVIAQIDIYLAVGIGQVALAGGATKWTTPYVERYISFCVSSGLKMMAMYVLVGGSHLVVQKFVEQARSTDGSISAIMSGLAIACGALLLAFVVYHCSKMVSSILGGSPAMTGSDFQAFMVPMVSSFVSGAMMAKISMSAAASVAAPGAGSMARVSGASGASANTGAAVRTAGGFSAGNVASVGVNMARSMPHAGHVQSPPSIGLNH